MVHSNEQDEAVAAVGFVDVVKLLMLIGVFGWWC
jgi:hypothetical protein